MKKWMKKLSVFALAFVLCVSPITNVCANQNQGQNESVLRIRQERTGLEKPKVMDSVKVERICNFKHTNVKYSVSAADRAYWTQFSSDYYYNQLTDAEKAVWNDLENACLAAVTGTGTLEYVEAYYDNNKVGWSEEELKTFLWIFWYSNPQYYFLENMIGYGGYGSNCVVMIKIYDAFVDGAVRGAYTEQFKTKVNAWTAEVAAGVRPEDKVKIANDIIALNTVYSMNEYDQSAFSMVCMGETVCAGYTAVLQILLNANGIETIEVTSETHAWNLVNLHGYWYGVDVTWADADDSEQRVYYDCYLKSNETLLTRDWYYEDHVLEPFWNGLAPVTLYDSSESNYEYESSYFTEGNYTYFTINENEELADCMAAVVASANGASVMSAPSIVNYDEKSYSVYKPEGTVPGETAPEGTIPEESVPGEMTPENPTQALNGLSAATDGNWYKYVNGEVDTAYTGLYCDENVGWWLVINGRVAFDYSGLYGDAVYGWWLVNNGAVNFDYSGLYGDAVYGWWLVNGGAVNFGYSGLYGDANYGWWLIDGGAVNFGYSGLYGDANYGWWLINGGAVNFGYNGLYGDVNYGWWLINGGAVNFGYTGEVYYEGMPYYVINGALV